MTMTLPTIGFIGLGIMGAPMAGHLLRAGYRLQARTRRQVPEALVQAGATACPSPRLAAERSDIVILMLPDTPDVADVLFAEQGVAAGVRKGSVVVDMSSISPVETRTYAQRIEALGADYLDAPVSGGDVGARNATTRFLSYLLIRLRRTQIWSGLTLGWTDCESTITPVKADISWSLLSWPRILRQILRILLKV